MFSILCLDWGVNDYGSPTPILYGADLIFSSLPRSAMRHLSERRLTIQCSGSTYSTHSRKPYRVEKIDQSFGVEFVSLNTKHKVSLQPCKVRFSLRFSIFTVPSLPYILPSQVRTRSRNDKSKAYEGGITAKVSATSFSHGNLAFPKISAAGWNSLMPLVRSPVRSTIVSSPIISWWW
jgi:hypothetical protein